MTRAPHAYTPVTARLKSGALAAGQLARAALIILSCLGLGKGLAALLPWPFPGSILGMLLLFIALAQQWLRLEWVTPVADLLLKHMGLLFVPVAVGLLAWLAPLGEMIWFVASLMALGIVLILAVVGWAFQWGNRTRSQR
ncbi:MAG: CidA/LrgA family protein [Aeromonas sp.]